MFLLISTFASMNNDNLKEKTSTGLFWSAINNGSTQVLNLVIGIFLGRLLTPAEYGVVGVLTVFIAIAGTLQASGFPSGLINMKEPSDRDYNSVFWFSVITSIILYIVLFLCAPLIAAFFHQPCLTEVSRVLFLSLPLSALSASYGAYMMKNMMNHELAIIAIVSILVSGTTGILLAYEGFSYWSLVVQQLTYTIVSNIGRIYYVPWHPTWHIDFEPIKGMFRFCSKILLTSIFGILNQQMLTFIFGRLFTIHVVGSYSQASKWTGMGSSLVQSTVGQISQTVLVSVSNEREREIRIFRKLLRFTAFFSFPIMFGLALVSKEFILIAIGEKWIESAALLQILCIGGAFSPIYVVYHHLIISMGRSNLYMWCNIGQIVIQLIIVLTLFHQGITSVVWAYTILNIVWLLVWQVYAKRLIGVGLIDMFKDIIPFAAISLAVMVATWFLTSTINTLWLLLTARIIIAAVLYAAIMKVLKVKMMEEFLLYFRKKTFKHFPLSR